MHGGGLSKQLIIGNIYRPPKDINENYKQFTHELSQVLSHFEELNADTIIAGDTNINLLKILEKEAFSDFLILLYHSSYPKITLPTRLSTYNGTLIDTFFCELSKSTIDTVPDI